MRSCRLPARAGFQDLPAGEEADRPRGGHAVRNAGRDPRGRVVTVSYYSIIYQEQQIQTCDGSDANQANWFPIDKLPPLAFDHDDILSCALKKIRNNFEDTIIEFDLLPEKPKSDTLQRLYEIVQGKKLEK